MSQRSFRRRRLPPAPPAIVPVEDGHCFPLGQVTWNDDVLALLHAQPEQLDWLYRMVHRHVTGTWDDADGVPSERERNLHALHNHLPIVTRCAKGDLVVYVKTNGQRTRTLISILEQ